MELKSHVLFLAVYVGWSVSAVSLQTHFTQHTQLRTGHVILTPLHTHFNTCPHHICTHTKEYIYKYFIHILICNFWYSVQSPDDDP
jgi:hypothetical protein